MKKNIVTMCVLSALSCYGASVAAEQVVDFNKVIVSAKAPVDAGTFAGSVTVISEEEIRASGATSVTELLEDAPSIQMVVTGNNSSKAPQIRGQAPEYTLVLVNGKRIPNTDRNLPFGPALRYNWVPLANIERIEVIRGPASSLYGADAMAGVVNIITRQASAKWSGSVSIAGEKLDSADGGDANAISFSLAGALSDNVDLVLAAESTSEDEIYDEAGITTLKSSKDKTNFQADLGVDLNDESRLQFGLLLGDEDGNDIDNGFRGVSNTEIDVERRRVTADYSTKLGRYSADFGLLASKADIEEGSAVWEVIENSLNVDLQGELTEKQYLSYGILHRIEEADRDDRVVFNDDISATMLYAQDVIKLSEQSNLTLGFAYDSHSKYDNELSPKIYYTHQLSPSIGLKLGYGESYLAPSLREGSAAYVVPAGPTRTYVGNDELQPETSDTFEVGMTFGQNRNQGSVTLFRSSIDDLITVLSTTDSFGLTTAKYSNVNKAEIQGLEAQWSFANESETSKLSLSYTYLDTENQSGSNKGKELTDRADNSAKAKYSYRFANSGITLQTSFRYVGDQFTDSANTTKIDSYSVYDAALVKSLGDNMNLRFEIENIGDKFIEDSGELIETGRGFKLTFTGNY